MLLNISTLTILQLFLILYLNFIFLIILYKLYLYIVFNNKNYIINNIVLFTIQRIFVLYRVHLTLLLVIVKIVHIQTTAIFFGHLLITNLSFTVFIAILLIEYLTVSIIVKLNVNILQLFQYIILTNILGIILNILWSATNYFTILLSFDCLNLIILFFLVLDSRIINMHDLTHYNSIINISIFFWVSFIATILFLMGGLFLIETFLISDLRLMLIFMNLMQIVGMVDNITLQLYITFFILGLFLKSGIGIFFIWKRRVFQMAKELTLIIYSLFYFLFVFAYIIFLLLQLIVFVGMMVKILIIILLILTLVTFINAFERGITIGDFIAISTLINTILILCCILLIA